MEECVVDINCVGVTTDVITKLMAFVVDHVCT